MKRYKYVRIILYNNGYTTTIPSNLELVTIEPDGYLVYVDENGDTVKARYDTTGATDVTISIDTDASVALTVSTGATHTHQLQVLSEDLVDVTTGCTYTSSNTGIATVSSGGLITGVAVGTCTITVTHPEYGAKAVVNITVTA